MIRKCFYQKLNKKLKLIKHQKRKKALNLLVNHRKVLKGFRCFCQKHGGSGGSGKKIKIQPEAVHAIVSNLRDRIHKYDDVLRTIEEYERRQRKAPNAS